MVWREETRRMYTSVHSNHQFINKAKTTRCFFLSVWLPGRLGKEAGVSRCLIKSSAPPPTAPTVREKNPGHRLARGGLQAHPRPSHPSPPSSFSSLNHVELLTLLICQPAFTAWPSQGFITTSASSSFGPPLKTVNQDVLLFFFFWVRLIVLSPADQTFLHLLLFLQQSCQLFLQLLVHYLMW